MANRTKFTLKARETFLDLLRAGNTATFAASAIGMRREGVYRHRADEPDFAAAWEQALEEGVDVLEQEAKRRAVEGVTKPVVQGGRVVTDALGFPILLHEYSDALLALLLKAKKPAVYRENVTVEQRGKILHEHAGRVDLKLASAAELDVLEGLARKTLNGHAAMTR